MLLRLPLLFFLDQCMFAFFRKNIALFSSDVLCTFLSNIKSQRIASPNCGMRGIMMEKSKRSQQNCLHQNNSKGKSILWLLMDFKDWKDLGRRFGSYEIPINLPMWLVQQTDTCWRWQWMTVSITRCTKCTCLPDVVSLIEQVETAPVIS